MSYLYYQSEPRLGFAEPPAQAAVAALTGPASPERGTHGDYRVTNAPAGATFSEWKFSDGTRTFSRSGNNNVADWSGLMVASGTISVKMKELNGPERVLALRVNVTPRKWSENAPAVPLPSSGNGTLPAQPRIKRVGLDPRAAGLGTSTVVDKYDINARVVPEGPNEGYNYLTQPPVTWNCRAFANSALYDASHPFFRAHDPARRGRPLPSNRLSIDTIRRNTEAHEGIIVPPQGAPPNYASHQQKLLNHLRTNPINAVAERDVSHRSVESNAAYGTRIRKDVLRRIDQAKNASKPHPDDIVKGNTYFDYPYIHSRALRLRVGGMSAYLEVTNPAGRTRWSSTNEQVVKIDGNGKARPTGPGNAFIRVTNKDGDIDEIPVTVT